MKKVGRMGYATEEERQAARRAASRRQTEKRRACRIPVASEPGSSTAEEPEPSTQVLPILLFRGTTGCGISYKELLSDRLVGELRNLDEEERDFALYRHFMVYNVVRSRKEL